MTRSAREAYLSYQAGIGTDEVILPYPFTPPRKKAEGQIPESRKSPAPALPDKMSGDFFQDVIKSLAVPSIHPRKKEDPKPAAPASAEPIDFRNLEEYWKHLAGEYPKWFPASGTILARGEGMPNPILALVEYAPTGGNPSKVFGGEPGELLDKMMKAIGLDRSRLFLTSIMKTAAPSAQGWARKDASRMLPWLFRELKLAGAEYVLVLGEAAAQAILKTGSPLKELRQKILDVEGLTFVASHHPLDLQRDESLKREAWTDLKWLQPRLPVKGSA